MASALRVVTYSRVSTSHHDQKPEIQKEALQKYCTSRGWKVTEEIIDHGYSGATDHRPGLKKLLKMVRERHVDAVVVLKMDRLFRSLKHLVTSLDEFEALGIIFVAVKDAIDYSTPTGRLFTQILGGLAEFEKSLLRERTILGLEYARRRGQTLGRPTIVNVDSIKQLLASQMSIRDIAAKLSVSKSSVHRIASRTKE